MDPLVVARTLYGSEYLKRFLAQGIRPDGRQPKRARPVAISGNECPMICRIGNSMVACGVKLELAAPKAETPDEGYLVPNVDIPALCDPTHKPGPPSLRSQVMSRMLLDILMSNHVVKLTDLIILKGKLCWCVYVDVMCLSDDGCLLDGVVAAAMAALRKVKIPKVNIPDPSAQPVVDPNETTSLQLSCHLAAATVVTLGKDILVDPTAEEIEMCESLVTVVTREEDRICGVFKQGAPVEGEMLLRCVQECCRRCNDIHSLLKNMDSSQEDMQT